MSRHHRRCLTVLATLAFATLGELSPARACAVCFGQAQGPLIEGAKALVWVMAVVTLGVQGAFVWFFYRLHRRAQAAPDRILVKSRMQLIKGEK